MYMLLWWKCNYVHVHVAMVVEVYFSVVVIVDIISGDVSTSLFCAHCGEGTEGMCVGVTLITYCRELKPWRQC